MIESPNIKTKRMNGNKAMENDSGVYRNQSIKLTAAKQQHSTLQNLLQMMKSCQINSLETEN